MKIKTKIVSLAAISLILVVVLMNLTNYFLGQAQLEEKQTLLEKQLLTEKKEILVKYLALAESSIAKIYQDADTPENRERVKSVLRDLRYDADGYFFVYDFNGVNQVLGPKPELEGKDLANLKDADGKLFIQNIIAAARSGDGYTQYQWHKPSVNKAVAKLSLSKALDKYNWIVGTGFYIDDIEAQLAAQRTIAEQELHTAIQRNLLISLLVLLL